MHEPEEPSAHTSLDLPAPTVWPMVLGLGVTLIAAGLITHMTIAVLGLLLSTMAIVGWFRNVLPHEKHETIVVPTSASAAHAKVRLQAHVPEIERFNYSFAAGVVAGLAGGVAMAGVAVIFSFHKFHSLWYGINLLAAGSITGWTNASDSFLSQFHLQGLLVALAIHTIVSVLVGLLYGSILPIFPRRSLITAGLIAPVLWSGMAYLMIKAVSPILSERIVWSWFIVSQVAFGLTAGWVIHLFAKVLTAEFQTLLLHTRAGLHMAGDHRSNSPNDGGKA